MGKEHNVRKYILRRNKYKRIITDYVEKLSQTDMPRVYMEWGTEGKRWEKGSSG